MKFIIPPESESYSAEFGESVIRTKLEGGLGRYRKDILNNSIGVTCSWKFDAIQYDYFMAFYRSVADEGATSFEIDLILDASELIERTANFIPGSLKINQRGLTYFVSVTLEVRAEMHDSETDLEFVEDFNEQYGHENE